MTQIIDIPTLFDAEPPDRELTIKEKFAIFHTNNPQVYRELEQRTQLMYERGRKKIGIAMLFEVMRWNYYLATNDPNSEFRLNNNYRALYARLLMDSHPEWGPIFELRESPDEGAHRARH